MTFPQIVIIQRLCHIRICNHFTRRMDHFLRDQGHVHYPFRTNDSQQRRGVLFDIMAAFGDLSVPSISRSVELVPQLVRDWLLRKMFLWRTVLWCTVLQYNRTTSAVPPIAGRDMSIVWRVAHHHLCGLLRVCVCGTAARWVRCLSPTPTSPTPAANTSNK